MHEMSVATALVDTVIESLKGMKATKVEEVIFEVGELAFISERQLKFSFDLLKKDHPVLKDTKLHLRKVKAKVKCTKCDFEGGLDEVSEAKKAEAHRIAITFECPKCGGTLDIILGRDMVVKRIAVEVADDKGGTK
jgi:hydrogenase nickel incorporation protein HypA/HybF